MCWALLVAHAVAAQTDYAQHVADLIAPANLATLGSRKANPRVQKAVAQPEDAKRDVLKVDADEDGVGGDDAADCLRYLVATKERKVAQRKLRGL